MRAALVGPPAELPTGPRNETLHWVGEAHADGAIGAFGGDPYGATKRCSGLGRRKRTVPLVPSVAPPMRPRSV
eukprot:2851626-Pyramimonas_sp.AAC.1